MAAAALRSGSFPPSQGAGRVCFGAKFHPDVGKEPRARRTGSRGRIPLSVFVEQLWARRRETMNTRNRKKRIYSWLGKAISEDEQLQLSSYRGISVKSKHVSDICIFPGEFILIEGENVDQFLVARLLKLYEDGTHEKRAVVEWFSRLLEIPLNQRKSMGREDLQEIFLNENPERDTDITVTHIIGNVTVIPLTTLEALPDLSNDEHIFFVRESWDGKKFKPLPLSLLAELKDSVKMKNNNTDFAKVHHLTPSRRNCSLEVETEKVTRSTRKSSAAMMEVESRHSASKSSHSKQRCSQRLAIGTETPGAKKKLQLNSPTKPGRLLAEQDMIELLDYGFFEPLEQSALKRKVTFTGIKGSPPKIPCAAVAEGDLFLDIKPLGRKSERLNKNLSSPCQSDQVSSLKARSSAVKRNATDSNDVNKQDKICKAAKESRVSKSQAAIPKVNSKTRLGEEPEAVSPTLTPRSRRKCVQATSARIAKHLSFFNTVEKDEEEEDDIFPLESSDSSSSDDEGEDFKVLRTPKRQARSTPKISRKAAAGTPAKGPSNTPEPRTPKTPRNATPRIRSRNQTTQKPGNVLEEARIRLHVSAVPESLPCREKEFQDIYNFIESKLIDGTGGCMYISGVPGTGKTATVHEVIRCLEQAAENNELPSFQCIEINGMKLTDPHQAYVQILNLLTGQKATAVHAAELLEKTFCKRGPKRKTVILVVDELDLLWTRKQNVMYNLFDWPTKKYAKLIVLAIANTMDLPERIMMNRVASRLGLTRMSFQPYTYKQLQQIVSSRMTHLKAFEEDAIQLVSRKVAALSGDARRCLDICRRAAEICEFPSQKSVRGLVSMAHIMEAIDEMFSSPYIHAIRNASLYEQIFLKATIAEFRRSGLEESTVQQIFHQHVALCRIEGLQTPTVSDALAVVSRLSAYRLLLTDSNSKYIHMRVRLNVSQDDIMYALKED
ncbi:origin recognition complex subunit 1 isoform X1 [Podarcis lilfordi]|uniref:Origin recognition complex subunit 1 n=2 Tax=Podarcis lilfordi TaxID=74358 RepID=A0AA35KHZ3_9SAUR|nr:origin recognition complex subunit 1 isoform X1 [Podarcis lilfordi]